MSEYTRRPSELSPTHTKKKKKKKENHKKNQTTQKGGPGFKLQDIVVCSGGKRLKNIGGYHWVPHGKDGGGEKLRREK